MYKFVAGFALLSLIFWSCKEELNKTGYGLLDKGDLVSVRSEIIGKENITKYFEPSFELFSVNVAVYGDTEIQISGDMAFSRGTYTLSLTPKEGGATTTFNGKWLDIEKRQTDGSWKIYIDMVNYNGPPVVE